MPRNHKRPNRTSTARLLPEQTRSLNRRRHRTTNQTVQPVVIQLFWPRFPFIHRASTPRCLDPIFGPQMIRKQPMPCRIVTEQRQATLIANRDRQSSLHKALPEIAVKDHMPYRSIFRREIVLHHPEALIYQTGDSLDRLLGIK